LAGHTLEPADQDFDVQGADEEAADFVGFAEVAFDFEAATIGQPVTAETQWVTHIWRSDPMIVQARPSKVNEFTGYAQAAKMTALDVQGEGMAIDLGTVLPANFAIEIGWYTDEVEGFYVTMHNQNVVNGSESGVRTGVNENNNRQETWSMLNGATVDTDLKTQGSVVWDRPVKTRISYNSATRVLTVEHRKNDVLTWIDTTAIHASVPMDELQWLGLYGNKNDAYWGSFWVSYVWVGGAAAAWPTRNIVSL